MAKVFKSRTAGVVNNAGVVKNSFYICSIVLQAHGQGVSSHEPRRDDSEGLAEFAPCGS